LNFPNGTTTDFVAKNSKQCSMYQNESTNDFIYLSEMFFFLIFALKRLI